MSNTRCNQPVAVAPPPRRPARRRPSCFPPIPSARMEKTSGTCGASAGGAPPQHRRSPSSTRDSAENGSTGPRLHPRRTSTVTPAAAAPHPPSKPRSSSPSTTRGAPRYSQKGRPQHPCTKLAVQSRSGAVRQLSPRQSLGNATPATHYYPAAATLNDATHTPQRRQHSKTAESHSSSSTAALTVSSAALTPPLSPHSPHSTSSPCAATPLMQDHARINNNNDNDKDRHIFLFRVSELYKASNNIANGEVSAAVESESPFTATGTRGSFGEKDKQTETSDVTAAAAAGGAVNGSALPTARRRQCSAKGKDGSVEQLLRAFLVERRASPEAAQAVAPAASAQTTTAPSTASAGTTAEAYVGLTPEEMQELFIVLQDLSAFLPAHKEEQQQQQRELCAMELPFSDDAPTLPGVVSPPQQQTDSRRQQRSNACASRSSGTKTRPHSPTCAVRVHSGDEHHGSVSGKQSVEGRYREALKTIEDAASDCQVALKRVQDYSESLYVLVQTWMHLHDNRFDEFAKAVLQRLLDNNPSYRVLFYSVDVPAQALVIMDMIGRAVVAFTRPADLMDIMGEMGARHNLYGLGEAEFISMREAFLQVYSEFVGAETFAKSVGVWKMFWKTMIELAVSGSSSERGVIYTQRRNNVWAERVTAAFHVLLPRQRSGGFHRLLQSTYKRAIGKYPELYVLQHMSDLRTAHRCMETLLRITKSVTTGGVPTTIEYNDQFSVQALFTDCGADFDGEVMKKMEEPFLEACESYLKPVNAWNIVVRAALQELWATYITGYWTAKPSKGDDTAHGGAAPDGKEPFCLMFTDIEASTRLWDRDTQTMGTAVRQHHQVIRGLIEDFGGYEVKTVGDSFLIATHNVTQALLIAFGIQLELMAGPSAPGFQMVENPQGAGAASCWRADALRVRVGIHYCTDAAAVYDSVHNRFDYYGPSVNCAARVEAAACGGQVLLSHAAYAHLCAEDGYATSPLSSLFAEQLGKLVQAQEARGIAVDDARLAWFSAAVKTEQLRLDSVRDENKGSVGPSTTIASLTHVEDIGFQTLKGIAEPVQLFSLLPIGLDGRSFHKECFLRVVASRGNVFDSQPFSQLESLQSATESTLLVSSMLGSPSDGLRSVMPETCFLDS